MGRVISTAIQFIDGFTKPSASAIKSMQKLGGEMQKTAKQIQNAGKAITNVGSTLNAAITLPIVGVATAALKMSNDFENAMAKVGTIADTTSIPMEALKGQVIDLSNAVGVGVADIAEAQYQAISAGIDTASSVDFVSTAVKAAKGGFTDTTTAVDGLTTVLNAYGLEAGKAAEISDQMLAAQNFGKTSFGDMASSMGKVIPIASSLNVSTGELFSSIAVLTKNGIATSEAVTGLKAAYSNILKPSSDASKTAQQLGLDFSAAHLQSVGWAEFLDEIKEKTGGNADIMAKLFGSTEALNSITVLAGKGSKDFSEALGLMADAGGATQAAYEGMLTPTERMNISFNKIKNALIQFGAALTPVFEKVAEIIGKVGDWLNSLSEDQVNNIVKWAGMAAAVGPVLMIFGKAVTAVGTVTKVLGTAVKMFGSFNGAIGLITSPAGIVIGVLALIAGAALLIIKNWDKVKVFLQEVGGWFKSAFTKSGFTVQGFKDKFSSIGESISNIFEKIGGVCISVAGIFTKGLAGSVSECASDGGNSLESFVGSVVTVFDQVVTAVDEGMQTFEALIDFLTGAFSGNWDSAAQGFRDSLENIFPPDVAAGLTEFFDNMLPAVEAVVSGIKSTFNGLIPDIQNIFSGFTTIFDGVGTLIKGIFSGDGQTAVEGFETVADGIMDTVSAIFMTRFDAVKNFVVGALSSFLPEDTVNKIAGVFDTVAGAWSTGIDAIKGYISNVIDAATPLLGDIKTILGGVTDFLKGAFTGDWKGAADGLKKIIGGAFSGLLNVVKAPFKLIFNSVKGLLNHFGIIEGVKGIVERVGGAIKRVFGKSGVDMGKFGNKIGDIKNRVGNIIENLKNIFKSVFENIGNRIKKTADIIAKIFGKVTGNTFGEAKTTVGSLKNAVSAAFGAIKAVIQKVMAFIVPVIKVSFEAAGGAISAVIDSIISVIDGVMTVFDGLITFISGVFTGDWEKAWEGVKDIFKGVFDTFAELCKVPLNAVIGIINGAISGINKLGLTIPEWVPGIGGQAFSINVPTIPMLYKGTDNWAGGAAVIHDRGGEIVDLPKGSRVYPHDKSVEMARRDGASGRGSVNINIPKLADKIEVRSAEDIDRIAQALVYKIKNVAFNTGTA